MGSNRAEARQEPGEDDGAVHLIWKWRKQQPARAQPELMRMAISGRVVSSARSDSWYRRCEPTAQDAAPARGRDSYDQYTRNDLNNLHTIVTLLRQQQPLLS